MQSLSQLLTDGWCRYLNNNWDSLLVVVETVTLVSSAIVTVEFSSFVLTLSYARRTYGHCSLKRESGLNGSIPLTFNVV